MNTLYNVSKRKENTYIGCRFERIFKCNILLSRVDLWQVSPNCIAVVGGLNLPRSGISYLTLMLPIGSSAKWPAHYRLSLALQYKEIHWIKVAWEHSTKVCRLKLSQGWATSCRKIRIFQERDFQEYVKVNAPRCLLYEITQKLETLVLVPSGSTQHAIWSLMMQHNYEIILFFWPIALSSNTIQRDRLS